MDYSKPIFLHLRRLGRKLGIVGRVAKMYRAIVPAKYEENFDNAIMSHLRPGDVIWDVGANVGYFTMKFADRVGPTGKIVAFEPAPKTFRTLVNSIGDLDNVRLEELALGDYDGHAELFVSGKRTDTANGLVYSATKQATKVQVRRGDTYCKVHPEFIPTGIKIDVEGFEYEVLSGLSETLKLAQVRSVFVEVHFRILENRGLDDMPPKVMRLLENSGFKTKWVDSSHLVATR